MFPHQILKRYPKKGWASFQMFSKRLFSVLSVNSGNHFAIKTKLVFFSKQLSNLQNIRVKEFLFVIIISQKKYVKNEILNYLKSLKDKFINFDVLKTQKKTMTNLIC